MPAEPDSEVPRRPKRRRKRHASAASAEILRLLDLWCQERDSPEVRAGWQQLQTRMDQGDLNADPADEAIIVSRIWMIAALDGDFAKGLEAVRRFLRSPRACDAYRELLIELTTFEAVSLLQLSDEAGACETYHRLLDDTDGNGRRIAVVLIRSQVHAYVRKRPRDAAAGPMLCELVMRLSPFPAESATYGGLADAIAEFYHPEDREHAVAYAEDRPW
jgi:hypothetical protein